MKCIFFNGDIMELEIVKNAFLEIDKISTLKNHIDKLVKKEIDENKINGGLEIDISYQDLSGNECFKSIPFTFEMELDDILVDDISLKYVNVYVVEGQGISVDYTLTVVYNMEDAKEIEIIQLDDIESSPQEDAFEKPIEEVELEEKAEQIEKIKENISKDYENKLADNLSKREENKIEIITSKGKENELDFLRFFDDSMASYFSVKTLLCPSEEMLNSIAKEYKVPMDDLLKGYDKANGKVTFRLTS